MDDFYSNQQVKEIWHELDGYNFQLREFLWQKNLILTIANHILQQFFNKKLTNI